MEDGDRFGEIVDGGRPTHGDGAHQHRLHLSHWPATRSSLLQREPKLRESFKKVVTERLETSRAVRMFRDAPSQ